MEGQQNSGSSLGIGILLGGGIAEHHRSVGETLRRFTRPTGVVSVATPEQQELAFLRAQNASLERQNATLRANYAELDAWGVVAERILKKHDLIVK